jgi:hypothetical protein
MVVLTVPFRTLFGGGVVSHQGEVRTQRLSYVFQYERPLPPRAPFKPGFPVCYHCSSIRSLHTMWSPFHPIVSLAAALFGTVQQHFDVTSSHGNLTRLTESQYAEFIPYIQFSRAAYCDPSKIYPEWKCGGTPFSSLCLRWFIEFEKSCVQCCSRLQCDSGWRRWGAYSVL